MKNFLQQDKDIMYLLNGLGDPYFDNFWILVSEKWFWIPLYIIFLYLLYKNYRLRDFLFILIFVVLGLIVSDQLAGIFKSGIMRLRPCHDPEIMHRIRVVSCGGLYGFYSGHASNSFFLATFLSYLLRDKIKWLPLFLFLWALVVSYSRIYIGVHFPLDIFFGAFVGFLLGGLFSNLALRVIGRKIV